MDFNGKYKAFVTDTNDPKGMGRIRVSCPSINMGYVSGWCEPCFPCEYDFYVPPVGACVWIEFQQGRLDKPLWLGGWYSENAAPADRNVRIIQYGGATIMLKSGVVYLNGRNVLAEIDALKQRVTTLESTVKEHTSQLSSHQKAISALQSAIG